MTGFGIYVHWPYCLSKCPYCDFVSVPCRKIDYNAWQKAYDYSLSDEASHTKEKTVSSIFFGGGTPSLMPVELIDAIIRKIKSLWPTDDNMEISLEANPKTIDLDKMKALRTAGITRLSIGAQSLNDDDLKFLGRLHSAGDALQTIKNAKTVFPEVSADFMYALPHQTLNDWKNRLDQILELNLKHLSLYQLTIEEGTFFYKKGVRPPEEELLADMAQLTDRMTYLADVPRYEISNHAATGHECRHNLLYWTGGEWVGTGPAAHGRYIGNGIFYATEQSKKIEEWLKNPTAEKIVLTPKEKAVELVLMALRTEKGIDRKSFFDVMKKEPEAFMHSGSLQDYQEDGLLIVDQKGIRATANGLMILDGLCRCLLL